MPPLRSKLPCPPVTPSGLSQAPALIRTRVDAHRREAGQLSRPVTARHGRLSTCLRFSWSHRALLPGPTNRPAACIQHLRTCPSDCTPETAADGRGASRCPAPWYGGEPPAHLCCARSCRPLLLDLGCGVPLSPGYVLNRAPPPHRSRLGVCFSGGHSPAMASVSVSSLQHERDAQQTGALHGAQ